MTPTGYVKKDIIPGNIYETILSTVRSLFFKKSIHLRNISKVQVKSMLRNE